MFVFDCCVSGFLLFQENVAIGIIPKYFDKYYNVAVNVYMCSIAIGIIVSPLFTTWFLDIYGWRGTLLLLCGINVQSVVFGALVPQRSHSKEESEERLRILQITPTAKQDSHKNFSLKDMLQKVDEIFNFKLLSSFPFIARIFVPSIAQGYVMTSWMIYVVSFALSNGASKRESSIVATWGGIGVAVVRLPTLNKYVSYKKIMYVTSVFTACVLAATTFVHSIVGMNITSFIYGMTYGIIGPQVYIAAKDVPKKDEYVNAVSWLAVGFGVGAIAGGALTGIVFLILFCRFLQIVSN